MKLVFSLTTGWVLMAATGHATSILAPGDFIIAVSANVIAPNSSHPAGEPPERAIDGAALSSGNKYLNFGQSGSGFIATPSAPVAMRSFTIGTGGDASERDPSRYEIWGTNSPITSTANSSGLGGENWVLLSVGTLSLPTTRNATSGVINISNNDAYASYKVVFPAVRNSPSTANSMQIGEFTAYTGLDGAGDKVFAASNPILAIDAPVSRSSFPVNEGPANLIDGTAEQKYLNFGGQNSGFIVTPSYGPSIVGSMLITSANDTVEFNRGPTSYEIYGTNAAISSYSNTTGDYEPWTLISSGSIAPTTENLAPGELITFFNDTEYTSYKVLFPTLMSSTAGLQIGEVQLFLVPEPGVALLSGVALLGLSLRRRRA
jgi:hypothetical protein